MLEYDITEFVLTHKDALKDDLEASLLPSPQGLEKERSEAILERFRQTVAHELNCSYEDVASIIDESFMNKWMD